MKTLGKLCSHLDVTLAGTHQLSLYSSPISLVFTHCLNRFHLLLRSLLQLFPVFQIHFYYASKVGNIYSCIKFGQVQMFSPFCGLALCVFEGIKNDFLVISVTFSLAKGKEMDTEIEKERETAEEINQAMPQGK